MTLVYELIFLVLVPASLFDLWQYRVPNALCFAALVISLIGHLDRISAGGISFWLAGIIIPFSVSFIFYVCHVFGASDSKLISVIGAFLGFRAALRILVYSIFVGAIMALFKMIWRKNMFRRFRYLFQSFLFVLPYPSLPYGRYFRESALLCKWKATEKGGFG